MFPHRQLCHYLSTFTLAVCLLFAPPCLADDAAPPAQAQSTQPASGSSVDTDTDAGPDVSAPATLGSILLPKNWTLDGALDLRYRQATSGRTDQGYLNQGELDIAHSFIHSNRDTGNIYVQLLDENVPDASGGEGQSSGLRFGEAYSIYRLPFQTQTGSTAYLKVGQFVLPVGLLPVYDTHQQILQTLAPLGIGERVNWGASIEGRFNGIIDYRFAVTSGDGPGHIFLIPDRVVSFRLGRLVATPYGVFNVGGSLLSGRLPVTEVDPTTGFAPVLPPSGQINPNFGFVNKTRIVGDAQWTYKQLIARGEAMSGSDANTSVNGYFLEGDYRFAPGLSGIISRTYWNYGKGSSTSEDNAFGIDIAYGNNEVTRLLYEERRDLPYSTSPTTAPLASTHVRHIFTVQGLVRF